MGYQFDKISIGIAMTFLDKSLPDSILAARSKRVRQIILRVVERYYDGCFITEVRTLKDLIAQVTDINLYVYVQ